MTEEHHIAFIYLETANGVTRKDLDHTGKPEAVFALAEGEKPVAVYEYCNLTRTLEERALIQILNLTHNISEYILARVYSLIQNKINTNIGVRILISVHLFLYQKTSTN